MGMFNFLKASKTNEIDKELPEISEEDKQIARKIADIIKTGEIQETFISGYSKFKKGDYTVSICHTWIPIYSVNHLNETIYTTGNQMITKYISDCISENKRKEEIEKFLNS